MENTIYTNIAGQLSFPSLHGRWIKYWPVWQGLRPGMFTCIKWQITLWHPLAVRWGSTDSYPGPLTFKYHTFTDSDRSKTAQGKH